MAEITKDSTLREVLKYYADKNKRGPSFVTEGVKLFKDIADEKGSAVKLFTPDKTGKTLLSRTLPNVGEEIGLKQPMQNLRQVGLILKGIVSPDDELNKTLPDASTNTEKNLRIFGIEEPAKAKSLVTIRVNDSTMNDFFSQIHEFKKNPDLEAIADATLFNLNTGLRPNAAAGLKVGGTYFPENGAIYIDAETKGAKGRRINVPLSPLADSILQKRIADGKVKDNQFFVKPNGKLVTSKDMTDLLKKVKIKDFIFDASTNKYYDSLAPEGKDVPGKRGASLLRNIHTKIGQKAGVPFERIAYLQGRSLVSAAQGSVGEVVTYATDFPGDIDPKGFDAQKANEISSIFNPSVTKFGYNLTGKEGRITPKTKGFESYFDAPVLDEVDESIKMKMGENDIIPTTQEVNSFADFTQEELDELEAGGITSAKKEAESLKSKVVKAAKTLKGPAKMAVAPTILALTLPEELSAAEKRFKDPDAGFIRKGISDLGLQDTAAKIEGTAVATAKAFDPGVELAYDIAEGAGEFAKTAREEGLPKAFGIDPQVMDIRREREMRRKNPNQGFINQNQMGE
tara:strand:+ start:56 stop:1765 length:1710 start_codon:yes stop_codon:yes gene_type:complete